MILELATIEIEEGKNDAFELQLEKAQHVLNQAAGYLGHEFHQCMEQTNKYVLLIQWENLEAHTKGFRASELFKEWRSLIGPFFSNPPQVEHYEMKTNGKK